MVAVPLITSGEEYQCIRFMTTQQVCAELGVDRQCLLRWRNQGMPYIPLGTRMVRYNLYDVLEWLEARKTASTALVGERRSL